MIVSAHPDRKILHLVFNRKAIEERLLGQRALPKRRLADPPLWWTSMFQRPGSQPITSVMEIPGDNL
jgi:hypothetical protein